MSSVRLDSATSDEPAYIAAGMIKLLHGRLDFFRDQPPLMNSLTAAPLVMAGYRMPPIWTISGNHWGIGKLLLFVSGYDSNTMLFLARLPTIALFVALCWAVYLFVLSQTGSGNWALFAFALTGFCPTVMAHGRLATVDVPAAFFSFVSAASFIRLLERPSLAAAAGAGAAAGAAVLTKTSANILGPYFLLLLLVALWRGTVDRRRIAVLAVVAAVVAGAFIWVFIFAEGSEAYAAASFPGLPRIAVPFAEYTANIRAIHGWYTRGADNPQFLLGRFSNEGWLHYYPVAMLLKMTIPAMAILAAALVLAAARRRMTFAAVSCLLFAALFLGIAAAGELALGIRYILPIFPFLFAAAAIVLSTAPRRLVMAAVALLVWHGAENLRAWPSYISYFNQLIGSHRNADRYLIDSNLDWGQDLLRLDRWLREEGVEEVAIHYFGGGVPQFDLQARVVGGYGAGGRALPAGSWFALSRHLYRVSFSPAVS
ncbi:MAG TPA: glycosyltransferase family 39 protein, partial [Thermoanaerobaculia bacterium]|nr:glycosyltransferase family 39 protein [Thermoanaerobaculia bacterium]